MKESKGSFRFGLWKAIRRVWKYFNHKTSFDASNSRRVKFWKNKWCDDSSLRESFLSLYYSIVGTKVSDQQGESGHLDHCFSRNLKDWRMEKVEALL